MSKRRRQSAPVVAVGVILALTLAACGSSSSPGHAAPTSGGAGRGAIAASVPAAFCQQLTGILADGPDPDADPVGYALSQIGPLRTLQSTDTSVIATVQGLATADQELVDANGVDKAAAATIKKDDDALDRACPGAAS